MQNATVADVCMGGVPESNNTTELFASRANIIDLIVC